MTAGAVVLPAQGVGTVEPDVAVDTVGGKEYQYVKLVDGTVDSVTPSLITVPADASAAKAGLWVNGQLMVFNGTTWDRARGTIANGLLVDVSRLPVAPANNGVDIGDVTVNNLPTAPVPVGITDTGNNLVKAGDSANNAIRVNIIAGAGSGGTAMTDDAPFTPGASAVTPMGAMFDDVTPDTVNEGDIGVPRMTQLRAVHVNLRDASGAEVAVGSGGGGGQQYIEDSPAAANPTGTALNLIRADALAAVADADGDNVAARGTNKGELYVKHADTVSTVIANAAAGPGNVTLRDTIGNSMVGQQVMASSLPVAIASNQSAVPVSGSVGITGTPTISGTVTANLGTLNGAATDAQLVTSLGAQTDAEASGNGSINALLKRLRTLLAGGLPTALIANRLDTNNGAWMGSTAPSVGQKAMAASIPVVVSSDQTAVPVSGSVGITGTPTVSGTVTANLGTLNGAATDSQLQTSVGQKADAAATGNGSLIAIVKQLRVLLAGGLPAALVGGRLDSNIGAWLGSTAPTVGQKTAANSLPAVLASDQSAITVKSAAGDEIAVVRTTLDPVDGAGTSVPIKFARVNATADGDNTIITGVGGKKLRVLGYALVASAAGIITIQDSAGTPAILAQFPLAANGGVSYAGGLECPAFETPTGNGLEISNPSGVDTLGHITYIEV